MVHAYVTGHGEPFMEPESALAAGMAEAASRRDERGRTRAPARREAGDQAGRSARTRPRSETGLEAANGDRLETRLLCYRGRMSVPARSLAARVGASPV